MDLASFSHYVAYERCVAACRDVRARSDLEQLVKSRLQTILTFESFSCRLIRLADMQVLDALHIAYPISPSDDTSPDAELNTSCPAIRRWIHQREPVLIEPVEREQALETKAPNGTTWPATVPGRNNCLAVHGMTDIAHTNACIFSFARERPWHDADRIMLERIVPHLYYAVSRTVDFGNRLRPGPLTQRERQVLQWVCSGKSNTEISSILQISAWTVKIHISHLLAKLNATNRSHAVAKAISFNLV